MPSADPAATASPLVERVLDGLLLELRAVIGRRWLTTAEAVRLSVGDVLIVPDASVPEIDLVAEGVVVARGELVDLEGERAVRVRKRLDTAE